MKEENPFEDQRGAEEWIQAVENERGTIRDKEIYPQLAEWINTYKIKTLADIGSGQGICSTKLGSDDVHYIGIEPSQFLITRANEIYKKSNREFIRGDAYKIPLPDNSVDGFISVTTWFHLADLEKATKELSRVLCSGGHFMLITPNPNAYDIWETFYTDTKKEEGVLIGKTNILLNPDEGPENYKFAHLSKNIFYLHTKEQILEPLATNGLEVDKLEEIGILPITEGKKIFLKILGHKP